MTGVSDAASGSFDLAANLRAELARRQMTYRELARRLGERPDSDLTEVTLTRRLNGQIKFRAEELPPIADVLGVSAAVLLGEEARAS